MRKLLAIGIVMLAGVSAVSGVAQAASGDGDKFVGAWRLKWLEQPGADGKMRRMECCGLLVYTRDGHMSVQVMDRDAQPSAAVNQYSQGGYEASYGTYAVDEKAHTFSFHVEGALVRTLVGKDLPRAYELSGKQMIVKSTRADEHWRVCWERY
jgi:Lipocalin-like domain